MFFLSRRQAEPLLGLDLQACGARLVELSQSREGRHVLEHDASEPMEPGWIVDGRIDKFDAVTQALRRLVHKARTRTLNVAMALPTAAVIVRKIVLPEALSPERLDAKVRAEAGQIIPFPLQDVYLDYCVLGTAGPSLAAGPVGGQVDVLLVAARRERVRDLQGLVEAAGLTPVIFDVASFAARRAVRRLIGRSAWGPAIAERTVALFDIGVSTITLQVLRGDEAVHESDHPHSGHAAADPRAPGPSFVAPQDTGAAPGVARLAQALAHALATFRASGPEVSIDAVLLAGDTAAFPGLAEAVADLLACPCRLVDPFEGMARGRAWPRRLGGKLPTQDLAGQLAREAPAYLAACGLALRRFAP